MDFYALEVVINFTAALIRCVHLLNEATRKCFEVNVLIRKYQDLLYKNILYNNQENSFEIIQKENPN